MLLRSTDGAVKRNGLIPFPDNRLQKAFEHLLLSCTKGKCYRYGVVFSMCWKCFCCWNTVLEKIHKIPICRAVLSPFAPAGAFCFSLGFIIMNETVRSLRKTWERGILWTSCKIYVSVQGEFSGKMCWRISLIKKCIQSCRSLSGEGNGEPLLSMVIPEGAPVWSVPAGEILLKTLREIWIN